MSSIIELRKTELTKQINILVSEVQFFIDNQKRNENSISISQYLEFNEGKMIEVKRKLQEIKNQFNPASNNFVTFESCINNLNNLIIEIKQLQIRGERKLGNLIYILPIKILLAIIFTWIYIWIWLQYWDWVEGWKYITMIAMVWYLPCLPFLLILYFIEEGDSFDFSLFRKFFTKLLLQD